MFNGKFGLKMTPIPTISWIRKRGYDGLVDAPRYIRIFEEGHGDYTKDWKKWLSNDFDSVISDKIVNRE
ncbi:hypothetical protein DSECCO2_92650 [anaerobic digester metagenome]